MQLEFMENKDLDGALAHLIWASRREAQSLKELEQFGEEIDATKAWIKEYIANVPKQKEFILSD